ncbi:MAG: dihydroorotate dehydrogenase-like protein [Ignavibacteria bacterium]|nr:dihydroorotate dehydrogenase-like protein [Ignavibacteria bacterium]
MDLTSEYMGIKLKNPLVASASPLSKSIGAAKACEDAGVSAIVCYSLFEEQLTHDAGELNHYLTTNSDSYAEALTYFPEINDFNLGPAEYLEHIRKLKSALDIPVIGSLNGVSNGGWINYAKQIEQAGADAIELNIFYIPTDFKIESAEVEAMYLEIIRSIKSVVNIPVAVKISPYFSAMANMAKKIDDAGADALVLFNRFYQPDIDLENLDVFPNLELSNQWELRLPLRWIAVLHGNLKASLAATSGIHNHFDVLKVMMVGGDVAMICSELLKNGINRASEILNDLKIWMEEKEYESILQMHGSMDYKSVSEPAAFERANYMKILNSYKI